LYFSKIATTSLAIELRQRVDGVLQVQQPALAASFSHSFE
jgi:hypothetical protein